MAREETNRTLHDPKSETGGKQETETLETNIKHNTVRNRWSINMANRGWVNQDRMNGRAKIVAGLEKKTNN